MIERGSRKRENRNPNKMETRENLSIFSRGRNLQKTNVCLGAYLMALRGSVSASATHFNDIRYVCDPFIANDNNKAIKAIDLIASAYKEVVPKVCSDNNIKLLTDLFEISRTQFHQCDECLIKDKCKKTNEEFLNYVSNPAFSKILHLR